MQDNARKDGLDYGIFERAAEAVTWFRRRVASGSRVRIVGDDDSDGTTSAFVLRHALSAQGYHVDLKLMAVHTERDADRAVATDHDAFVIADCGSAFLERLDGLGRPVLVLDHHSAPEYEGANVFEVNPRRVGAEAVDFASASVVSQVFAEAWDEGNRVTAFAAAAGGIADRQHLSGFRGLLDHVVDQAVVAGHTDRRQGLTIPGPTVAEAIRLCIDPYFDGLTGNEPATRQFLQELGVEGDVAAHTLAPEQAQAVAAALTKQMGSSGVVGDRIYPPLGLALPLFHPSGVGSLFALTRILETITAADEYDMALSVLEGDPKAAAEGWARYEQRVGAVLAEVARMRPKVEDHGSFRVARTRDSTDTGVYAHTFLTYVFGDDKPMVVWFGGRTRSKFSGRGSPRLYQRGVDLSVAMGEAASACGGNGGGHPAASGAAVDASKTKTFLKTLAVVLERLGAGEKA